MTQTTVSKTKRQVARRAQYLKQGLCIACQFRAVTKRHCEYHRQQHNANSCRRAKKRRGTA